jgi:aspartate racemase
MRSMGKLGILGGMGPLASAEFLSTIYRLHTKGPEQRAPVCLLYSDPSFPDRTEAILNGSTDELTRRTTEAVEALLRLGADRVVMACVTLHHVFPELPAELRERMISLIDTVVDEILLNPRPLLLLATTGTRAARIFERHPRWSLVERWVRTLDEPDQEAMHDWLYRLKVNQPPGECAGWLEALRPRYGNPGLIFGCTELHLVHRAIEDRGEDRGRLLDVIDPLLTLARQCSEGYQEARFPIPPQTA